VPRHLRPGKIHEPKWNDIKRLTPSEVVQGRLEIAIDMCRLLTVDSADMVKAARPFIKSAGTALVKAWQTQRAKGTG